MIDRRKEITELPILTNPSLSGITVVVQDGITYKSPLESIGSLFSEYIGGISGVLNVIIDGFGFVIPTGISFDLQWVFAADITGWGIFADKTGLTVIDVWETTFNNFPPIVSNSITGSEKPTLSNQIINQNLNLTTWTSSLAIGDIWRINVDSAATITRVTVSFHYVRTI